MTSAVTLFLLLAIADVALWVLAIVAPLSPNGRFRAFAAAIFLLGLLSGSYFGWSRTLAVGGLVAWVAAIAVANTKRLAH